MERACDEAQVSPLGPADRTDAARQSAALHGLSGLRFPWESAFTGQEVDGSNVQGGGGVLYSIDTTLQIGGARR